MIRCPNCGRTHPRDVVTCDCGFELQPYIEKQEASQKIKENKAFPYQALPVLLVGLRAIGVLMLVSGAIYAFSLYKDGEPFLWVITSIFGGLLAGVPYFVLSEASTILLHMSEKQDKMMQKIEDLEIRK